MNASWTCDAKNVHCQLTIFLTSLFEGYVTISHWSWNCRFSKENLMNLYSATGICLHLSRLSLSVSIDHTRASEDINDCRGKIGFFFHCNYCVLFRILFLQVSSLDFDVYFCRAIKVGKFFQLKHRANSGTKWIESSLAENESEIKTQTLKKALPYRFVILAHHLNKLDIFTTWQKYLWI